MAINVADNFSYKGGKPLDNRTKYSTIASMVATPAADLYDGCLAYVTSTKKNYQYDSTNTVDENLGKWRELQTGGSGEGIPAGGTTGQVLAKKTGTDYDVEWVNDQTADTSKCYKYDDNVANTIQDEDYFPYYNVSMSAKQQSTWTNIKSDLKTYFDQYYSGGGGGTSDYNDLSNKPQIAGTTLSGNTSLATLGLTSSVESQSSGSSTKSYVSRGEKYDWNTGSTWYGTCTTSASTTAKSVLLARGTLNFTVGAKIAVKFSYNNTASAPTLTVNSTTKNIKYIDADDNVSTPLIWWNAGDIVEFTYDGTQWLMQPTMQMLFSGQGTKIPREQIYSTSEKIVGCWTDGRPVYQKTITSTLPTPTSDGVDAIGTVSIGASIATLVSLNLMAKKSEGTTICVNETAILDGNGRCVRVYGFTNAGGSDANKVSIVNNKVSWGGITCYITVQYTKTTDAANSFKYGDPNEYSTTEKIVGSWIDGKPLYQKTITYTMPTISTDGTRTVGTYTSTGTTIKTVVDIQAIAYNSSGAYYELLNRADKLEEATNPNRKYSRLFVMTNSASSNKNTVCIAANDSAFSGATAYITIKYTKS